MIKSFIYRIISIVFVLIVFSCGSDDVVEPPITILLRSQSITEGAEVDAKTTNVLTLQYNYPVKVTGKGINGVIASGSQPQVLEQILDQDDVGTFFAAK